MNRIILLQKELVCDKENLPQALSFYQSRRKHGTHQTFVKKYAGMPQRATKSALGAIPVNIVEKPHRVRDIATPEIVCPTDC